MVWQKTVGLSFVYYKCNNVNFRSLWLELQKLNYSKVRLYFKEKLRKLKMKVIIKNIN